MSTVAPALESASVTGIPDEDYNEPGVERQEVLNRLHDALGEVPKHFWAACYVCDLQSLRQLAEIAANFPSIIRTLASVTTEMMSQWNKSFREASSVPASSRCRSAYEEAVDRDGPLCVITRKNLAPQVAHIYPSHMLEPEENKWGNRHIFWEMLKNFWPEEKVAEWMAEIFLDGIAMGVETPANMITLSSETHEMWSRGGFALKPLILSGDECSLMIQVFYQKPHDKVSTADSMSLRDVPPSTRGLTTSEPYSCWLDRLTEGSPGMAQRIRSGDIITLTTDNKTDRPLPSFKLLEMQFFLQRVVGMASGPELDDYGWSSDEDTAQPAHERLVEQWIEECNQSHPSWKLRRNV